MYEIAGVHHIAIGVKNLEIMKSFYKDMLGFNILEAPALPNDIMSGIMRGATP
jgi:catechol 2,3-dioxygenase-like lactoylglutathione lyase family enzyme